MEKRHSSPSSPAVTPRPQAQRQRSNSFPIVEALGCSTPEARLILAEGRAAVSRRNGARERRGRLDTEEKGDAGRYRPKDHMKYLYQQASSSRNQPTAAPKHQTLAHLRVPSVSSDGSTSTITPTTGATAFAPESPNPTGSPLWDYSANLARFVQNQLNSISTYSPMSYLRHGTEVPAPCKSPPQSPKAWERPQSPAQATRRSLETPGVLEMPPMCPPVRSAFSAWSSTDDDTGSEASPLPSSDLHKVKTGASTGSNFTPSFLKYYENANGSSFLLTSTPTPAIEEREEEKDHPNAENFVFPEAQQMEAPLPVSRSSSGLEVDCSPPTFASRPQLTSSSAPSLSSGSASTASYFDAKRSMTLAPQVRDRLLGTKSSSRPDIKVLAAISPFEGSALSNVHDVYVDSPNRVRVDGLAFDMMRPSDVQAHC